MFDLTHYTGHKVIIRFHFGSSEWKLEHPGWYIDYVSFLDIPPPVAGTGICTVTPSANIVGYTSQDYSFVFKAEENIMMIKWV